MTLLLASCGGARGCDAGAGDAGCCGGGRFAVREAKLDGLAVFCDRRTYLQGVLAGCEA